MFDLCTNMRRSRRQASISVTSITQVIPAEVDDDEPPIKRTTKRTVKQAIIEEDDEEDSAVVPAKPAIKQSASASGNIKPHTHAYHHFEADEIVPFRTNLIDWYRLNRRKMPWRGDAIEDHTKQTINTWIKENNIPSVKQCPDRIAVSPYGVWVSEIMLQQTRVPTVVNYWIKWMINYPTIKSLAEASEESVNQSWAGLGYYTRARSLHSGAKYVMDNLSGVLPSTVKELQAISGVGPYSAGAISSIAFNQSVGLVDGNVSRVFSRLRAVNQSIKEKASVALHWKLADQLTDIENISIKQSIKSTEPADFNQALMELGATICTPKNPSCDTCPVRKFCRAYQEVDQQKRPSNDQYVYHAGNHPTKKQVVEIAIEEEVEVGQKRKRVTAKSKTVKQTIDPSAECDLCDTLRVTPPQSVTEYPQPTEKSAALEQHVAVCVVVKQTSAKATPSYLFVRRPSEGLLAGQWEFPSLMDCSEGEGKAAIESRQEEIDESLSEWLTNYDAIKKSNKQREPIGSFTHVFSHRKHHMHAERLTIKEDLGIATSERELRWATEKDFESLGLTAGVKKVWQLNKKH